MMINRCQHEQCCLLLLYVTDYGSAKLHVAERWGGHSICEVALSAKMAVLIFLFRFTEILYHIKKNCKTS